jgi:hypothetical protein
LAALVGGDANASKVVEQHRADLQTLRTIHLGKVAPAGGTADFFVIVTSSGGEAKVAAAKFINGEEKLKALAENLRNAKTDFVFPDDTPTKILRRGTLTCSKDSHECDFVMMIPEDVHSVD